MTRHTILLLALMAYALAAAAQTDNDNRPAADMQPAAMAVKAASARAALSGAADADAPAADFTDRAMLPSVYTDPAQAAADSLHLPPLTMRGEVQPVLLQPLYWGGWNRWDLHKGMNVSLGASVFAEFGKHARSGAGFAQTISAMYALPVTDKLSVAVGGYFNNVMWQHDSWREAGLSAVVGYKFNDHWEAYVYGQKSLAGNRRFMPMSVWDTSNVGDRIGAAVKYNVNRNFSFQVSVEQGWTPSRFRPRATFGPDGFQPEW